MRFLRSFVSLTFVLAPIAPRAFSQTPSTHDKLDLTAGIERPILEPSVHRALPEQFIWLAMPPGTAVKTDEATPRHFRVVFRVEKLPQEATLYVSGPDHIRAYVNGKSVASGDRDPKIENLSARCSRVRVEGLANRREHTRD